MRNFSGIFFFSSNYLIQGDLQRHKTYTRQYKYEKKEAEKIRLRDTGKHRKRKEFFGQQPLKTWVRITHYTRGNTITI